MTDPASGPRIARWRRRRGLSQVALAGLVGRSESWLSQVERGVRRVDSLGVLRDLARVLRVELDDLAPPAVGSPRARAQTMSDSVEQALFAPVSAEPIAWSRVVAVHAMYQAARYGEVVDDLPGVIAELSASGDDRVVVAGWTAVAKALTKVGLVDLALLAADRASERARRSTNATDGGMAVYQVVAALLPTARAQIAEELAVRSAEDLGASSGDPAVCSVAGALWQIAAVAAARRGDAASAWERLDRAGGLADRLGRDANLRWTAFGPTNVALHRVSVAAELGDAAAALVAAERLDVEGFPSALEGRRVQVGLDLAWAFAARRRDGDAVLAVLEVERTAPQVTRHNVYARSTISTLLGRARGSTGATVRAIAARNEVGW